MYLPDVWLACGLQTVLVLIVMTGIKKWWKWAYARQVEYKAICLKSRYRVFFLYWSALKNDLVSDYM